MTEIQTPILSQSPCLRGSSLHHTQMSPCTDISQCSSILTCMVNLIDYCFWDSLLTSYCLRWGTGTMAHIQRFSMGVQVRWFCCHSSLSCLLFLIQKLSRLFCVRYDKAMISSWCSDGGQNSTSWVEYF